ncbi:MAG: type I polyketide synthase, partial [Myxococcota bacterium]
SARGRCFAFDHRADGIVPGEAAAAVVCKRLDDALAAGDHIYGVIAGTGINQDGKTNGITAPSASSQMELMRSVYRRAGISPATIGYVEAHGTGTKLGDPIEWEALTAVYREHNAADHSCAIGSIKSNIGHTAAAAGIVGLQKVLLSLAHKQLPPSINFERGNEHIDFEHTPFHVNTTLKEWPRIAGQPRRAAISSFGFSGTNAHLVVEEYLDHPRGARPSAPSRAHRLSAASPARPQPTIVPLSARRADRLPIMAAQLCARLRQDDPPQLPDIAYTLQVGRSALEHRAAFIARDTAELCAKLDLFVAQQETCPGIFVGQAARDRDLVGYFYDDEDLGETFKKWLTKGKLEPLAGLWVKGLDLDWTALRGDAPGRRIPLPTYPFATDRYWLENEPDTTDRRPSLHPLVHENTSIFGEQRFSSRFTGHERIFSDHRIGQTRVLPGVAQLEMVRAAVALSGRATASEFHHVLWTSPLVAHGAGPAVQVTLRSDDHGIRYQIASARNGTPASRQLHGQGLVTMSDRPAQPPPRLDLARRLGDMSSRYPADLV